MDSFGIQLAILCVCLLSSILITHCDPERIVRSGVITTRGFSTSTTTSSFGGVKANDNKKNWFSGGLPFKCTGCGKCCTWDGTVTINKQDALKISEYLNISVTYGPPSTQSDPFREFVNKYVTRDQVENTYILVDRPSIPTEQEQVGEKVKKRKKSKGKPCVFLTEDNKCSIYPVRPYQCIAYPFWPGEEMEVLTGEKILGILESRNVWNAEQKLCEGINHPDSQIVAGEAIAGRVEKCIEDFKDCIVLGRTRIDAWAAQMDAERE